MSAVGWSPLYVSPESRKFRGQPRNWFSKSICQTNLIYPQSVPTILIWIWAMKLRVLRQKMTKNWGGCLKRGHVFRFACCGWHRSLHHRWVLGWCSNSTVLQLGCKKKQSYMSLFIYQACFLISAITSNRTRKCNRSKKKKRSPSSSPLLLAGEQKFLESYNNHNPFYHLV